MDVDLDDGGMSAALFEDNIEWWASILDDFQAMLSKDKDAADHVAPAGHGEKADDDRRT